MYSFYHAKASQGIYKQGNEINTKNTRVILQKDFQTCIFPTYLDIRIDCLIFS